LFLSGLNWKDGKTDGFFAIEIIAIIVFSICLGLTAIFKWTRHHGGRDKARTALYIVTAISYIINTILNVVDTGLREAETETIQLYYLTYIFLELFSKIAEVCLLAVVLRTIVESTSSRTLHKFFVVNIIALVVVAVLTITHYGFYIARFVNVLKYGYSDYGSVDVNKIGLQLLLAYNSVYFVAVIYAACIGTIILIKERSLPTLLISALVVPALFLRVVLDLATIGMSYDLQYGKKSSYYDYYYSKTSKSYLNLAWADAFFYVIATIVIMVGLAVIGVLRPKQTTYETQHQKNNAAPVGYEYGTHVPVYH